MKDLTLVSEFKEEDYLLEDGNCTIPEYLLPRVEKAVKDGKSDWLVYEMRVFDDEKEERFPPIALIFLSLDQQRHW